MIAAFLMTISLGADIHKDAPKIVKPFNNVEACLVEADKLNRGMNGIGFDNGSIADDGVVHFCTKIIYPM